MELCSLGMEWASERPFPIVDNAIPGKVEAFRLYNDLLETFFSMQISR